MALIVALYLTRNNRKYQCIIGAVMMLFELTAPGWPCAHLVL